MAARMMPQILSTQPQPAIQLVKLDQPVTGVRAMPRAKETWACRYNREVESTDVGSSGSDAESGWSSASDAPQIHPRQLQLEQERSKTQTLGTLGQAKRQRPKSLAKRVRLQAGQYFRGTPLTPIPGTPKAYSSSSSDAEENSFVQAPESVPPAEASGAPPGLPGSPKRRARQALLDRARCDGIPLKVRIPEDIAKNLRSLDYSMPAKKRPPLWPDLALSSSMNLDPSLPAKKCLSPFLLESPCFVDL